MTTLEHLAEARRIAAERDAASRFLERALQVGGAIAALALFALMAVDKLPGVLW